MRFLQGLKEWDAQRLEILEKRRREEAAAKEHKKEEERRRVAACREEREKKLERVRRAKAAMEENPDAQKKGKWPRCTQQLAMWSMQYAMCLINVFQVNHLSRAFSVLFSSSSFTSYPL